MSGTDLGSFTYIIPIKYHSDFQEVAIVVVTLQMKHQSSELSYLYKVVHPHVVR